MSGKNLDHSKFYDNRPKTAIFQLWADFDGNLAQQLIFLMVQNENSDFPWNPGKNRMSGKILGDF